MLGGLGVGRVGVVEQRGGEEGGKIDGDEDEQERSPCSRRGGAERRLAGLGYGLSFRQGRKSHLSWLGENVQNNSEGPWGVGAGR